MKQTLIICIVFFLSSCMPKNTTGTTNTDSEVKDEEIVTSYDKNFLNVKGNVKMLTYEPKSMHKEKQIFHFNREGEIVAWYEEQVDNDSHRIVTMPVLIKRDYTGRIITAIGETVARARDEVYVQTYTYYFYYDKDGHLFQINQDIDGSSIDYSYAGYNEDGAPTKKYINYSNSDPTYINYSDMDTQGNWQLAIHTNTAVEVLSCDTRKITYYSDTDDDSYSETEKKKYQQAIKEKQSTLEAEVQRRQAALDEWNSRIYDQIESHENNTSSSVDVSQITTGTWYINDDDEDMQFWYTYNQDGTGNIEVKVPNFNSLLDVSFEWSINNSILNVTWDSNFAAIANSCGWNGEIRRLNEDIMEIFDSRTYTSDVYKHKP